MSIVQMTSRVVICVGLANLAMACGDPAGLIEGEYVGELTAGSIAETNYKVTVGRLNRTTVSFSGDDFATVEISVMNVGSGVASTVDSQHQLSWTNEDLSVNSSTAIFNGGRVVSVDGSSDDGGGDDPNTDDVSQAVVGTYTGLVSGPVNEDEYTLTATADGPRSVRLSGPGIQAFVVPLAAVGNNVEAEGVWDEGTFLWSAGELEVNHSTQELSFSGAID